MVTTHCTAVNHKIFAFPFVQLFADAILRFVCRQCNAFTRSLLFSALGTDTGPFDPAKNGDGERTAQLGEARPTR